MFERLHKNSEKDKIIQILYIPFSLSPKCIIYRITQKYTYILHKYEYCFVFLEWRKNIEYKIQNNSIT